MIWIRIILLCSIGSYLLAQESQNLAFTADSLKYNTGAQISEMGNGLVVAGPCHCETNSAYPNNCLGVLLTDESGDVAWRMVYDGAGDTLLHGFNYKTLVVVNSTIYISSIIWKDGQKQIRMIAIGPSGEILYTQDYTIPHEELFLEGMILANEQLIVFGQLVTGGHQVFLRAFDLDFELIAEADLGASNYVKRGIDISLGEANGFLLAYGEQLQASQVKMSLVKLDEDFNVLHSKEIPASDLGDPFSAASLLSLDEGRYALGWFKDISNTLYDTFPFPTAIYFLDSLLNVESEYVFVNKAAKQHIELTKTSDGKLFGAGGSDHFYVNDIFPDRAADGWCFLMDQDGSLLWEKIIADNRHDPPGGIFRQGIETGQGFALVGEIGLGGIPETYGVWLLTLDENGCWQGNCEQYLVIDHTTASSSSADPDSRSKPKAYPNPGNGRLTIDWGGDESFSGNRTVKVLNLEKKLIASFMLNAQKSTIDLSHMGSGVYFVVYEVDNQPVSTSRIIIHP